MAKDDISEILLEFKKDMLRAVDGKVNNKIKQIYKEEVDEAYNEYEPTSYQRRYDNNGFGDESNFDEDISLSNSGINYTLTNEAKPSYQSQYRLDEIIEEGKYNWKNKPEARPVYKRTQEKLESENIIENELEDVLSSMGWELK